MQTDLKHPFSEIKILSQDDATKLVLENPNKYNVVSLWSGGGGKHGAEQPNFKGKEKSLCQQRFHDIILETWQAKAENKITPDDNHIKTILEFAKTKYNEPLIVHCYAGISRSSAITFCILLDYFKHSDNPIENTINELVKIKPIECIKPNKRIVNLGIYNIAKSNEQVFNWLNNLTGNEIYKNFY